MANPFFNRFDSKCDACGDWMEEDSMVYAHDGGFICSGCAVGADVVCECGNYKKDGYETCYTCRFGG